MADTQKENPRSNSRAMEERPEAPPITRDDLSLHPSSLKAAQTDNGRELQLKETAMNKTSDHEIGNKRLSMADKLQSLCISEEHFKFYCDVFIKNWQRYMPRKDDEDWQVIKGKQPFPYKAKRRPSHGEGRSLPCKLSGCFSPSGFEKLNKSLANCLYRYEKEMKKDLNK